MKKLSSIIVIISISLNGCSLIKQYSPSFWKERPNVVLIIIDTLRADKLGCYGFPENISPAIDQIALNGILFENVISQCSWTRPSIGSMLTSLYPRAIGIYKEKFDILHGKYQTLAEILKANGYYTLGITANPNINSVFNFHQGFDDYQDSTVIWTWMKPQKGQTTTKPGVNLHTSADIFNTALKKASTSKHFPWYIQIVVMEVHTPSIIRNEYKQLFSNYPRSQYYSAIKQVSFDIENFIQRLCSIPGWENTLFVLTSDHGEGLDDHPDVPSSHSHGNLLYESQMRVPLIFFHTKTSRAEFKQKRIKQPVRLLDLLPTLLDYIGISPPNDIEGRSLINLMKGKGEYLALPDCFVTETNWRNVSKIAIYSDRWKYIENYDNWPYVNKHELQPMGIKENGMKTDKISSANEEVVNKLKKYLDSWQNLHIKSESTAPESMIRDREIEQLKSLGYIE